MRSSVELGGGDGSCDEIGGPYDIDLGTSIDVSVGGSASLNLGGSAETPPPPPPAPTLDPAQAARLVAAMRSTPAGRLGVVRSKIETGASSFVQRAGSTLVQPAPAASGGMRRMALFAEPEPISTGKKVAVVVGGVGALGTVVFLAWQAMR